MNKEKICTEKKEQKMNKDPSEQKENKKPSLKRTIILGFISL